MIGLTDFFNEANSVLSSAIISNKYLILAGWVIFWLCDPVWPSVTQFYKYLVSPSEQVTVEGTGAVVYRIPEVEPAVRSFLADVPAGLVWRGEQPVVNVVVLLQRTLGLLHQFWYAGAEVVAHLLSLLISCVVVLTIGILLKLSRHSTQLTRMTF